MDIREELKTDFDYLNKRLVRYTAGVQIMTGETPPCFEPVVNPEQLQIVVWNMQELVRNLQKLVEEGD